MAGAIASSRTSSGQTVRYADMFSAIGAEPRLRIMQLLRESTFLRYTANTDALHKLLGFLYSECCTRNKAPSPREIIQICK